MIPTFDDVMKLTSTISNVHMFQPEECKAMYDTLLELPDGATVVEIGCDVGRTSSLIFQMARAKNLLTIHIDPWQWHLDRAKQWMEMMSERCEYHPFVLLRMTTVEAEKTISRLAPFDLAFIDGSHDQPDVEEDLRIVASRVKPRGFLAAHDYPSGGVTEAIDSFISTHCEWIKYKQAAPGFGIWYRK